MAAARGEQDCSGGSGQPAKPGENREALPSLGESESEQAEPAVREELSERPTDGYKSPGKSEYQNHDAVLGAARGFFGKAMLSQQDGSGYENSRGLRSGDAAQSGSELLEALPIRCTIGTGGKVRSDASLFGSIKSSRRGE